MLRPTMDERRQYLADIAIRVFARKGYANTSLQKIAQEADISKAGLYHYFETKEDILYYSLKTKNFELLKALKDSMKKSEESRLSPEQSFRELIYTYATFINNQKDLRLMVLQDRHQLTGENKVGLIKIEQEILKTIRTQVARLSGMNKKYNPNVISFMVISMSHWLGAWLKDDGELNQDEAIKQSADIILHGVFK